MKEFLKKKLVIQLGQARKPRLSQGQIITILVKKSFKKYVQNLKFKFIFQKIQ
jgi:hypothetical protein